ncbi:YiiD C-terminal domain-containing protein [Paenacidovorax monticola]|uniref:YiiD C-terminal domain-containing protein n=2 Tax=Paenacidovorax monticola TaxID=1926868 RepID=A0A7H0HL49_9BURK|nr:YiiD C-terminal domain-containing protein [Paenacidovorax monticola]
MAPSELERYLHEHIPLSRAMAVEVVSADPDGVLLRAPLAPNINHRDTVFGGSASALSILAAWSLLHQRLWAEGLESRLVIQRNTTEYEQPIAGAFLARSALLEPQQWPQFTRMLARKGKARIAVASVLSGEDGVPAGRLVGEFVALDAGQAA